MKTIKVEHSEIMSILIEAIIHSQQCTMEGKLCNVEKGWSLVNNENRPDKIIISSKISKSLKEYVKKEKLDYYKALRLTICLAEQIGALNEMGLSISHIEPSDILVLSENWYLITNTDNILPLEKDKINIIKPVHKSMFTSPEMSNINTLPTAIDHRSSYYSIALVVLFSLGLKKDNKDIEKLYPTSLYFLLQRCLQRSPSDRVLLLV